MASTRLIFIIVVLLAILTSCYAGTMLQDIMVMIFGEKAKQRSMSEIITNYLDELFPKDDMDTETMKNIFTMYAEENNNVFSSDFSGVDYLFKK